MNIAGENNNFNHQRLIIYAVTTLAFPLAYHFLRISDRQSRAEFHALPNAIAISMILTLVLMLYAGNGYGE